MEYNNISPYFEIQGKGGSVNICKVFARTFTQKELYDFFGPSEILWQYNDSLLFEFDIFTNRLIHPIGTKKSIEFNPLKLSNLNTLYQFNEETKENKRGTLYESELKFLVDRDKELEMITTLNLNHKQTVIVILYSNGEGRIMGNGNSACNYLSKLVSSMKAGQTREVSFNWSSQHTLFRVLAPYMGMTYNFDLTMSFWDLVQINGATTPVVDQATFEQWLLGGTLNGQTNNLTSVSVSNFIFDGSRLRCNLYASGTFFAVYATDTMNLNKLGILEVDSLELRYNSDVTSYKPKFYNPNLKQLDLSSCSLTKIDVSLKIPSTATHIFFTSNLITNQGYIESEDWANGLPVVPTGQCTIDFQGNTDPVSGTNLETILTTKGYTVI